jgi:hypothetical protein
MAMKKLLIAALVLAACSESPTPPVIDDDDDPVIPPPPTSECQALAIPVPSSRTGTISTADCKLSDNTMYDVYRISFPKVSLLRITLTGSNGFSPLWTLHDTNRRILAVGAAGDANASRHRVLLLADTYTVTVEGFPGQTGGYNLNIAEATAGTLTNCEYIWTHTGVTIDEVLTNSTCNGGGSRWWDNYVVVLRAGDRLTASITQSDVRSEIRLYNFATGAPLGSAMAPAGSRSSSVSYTTSGDMVVLIEAGSAEASRGGNYRLTIQ